MKSRVPEDIDKYIEGFPSNIQKILQRIRKTIQKAAPRANEAISYAIPTFKLNGNLIHFAAYEKHIGLYPAPREVEEFKNDMARYEGGKGTARFPLDEPIPYELIARIVTFRVGKNMEKTAGKRTAAKKQTKKRVGGKKSTASAKKRTAAAKKR